ncbi:MAG: nucleoside transporter [Chitinivibrionales bacterium]|nr:nucleoside transporter [Chitinivibrionales bacterium]
MEWYNLVSFAGIFVLLAIAWIVSPCRSNVNWRAVVWGLGIQLAAGLFIFVVLAEMPEKHNPFLIANNLVNVVIESSAAGAEFLFGSLTDEKKNGFIFAVQALPTIIFFSALISILYFIGLMPWLIRQFARLFTRLMKISGAESVCAAGNIFVGIESTLTIKPHLAKMTPSELCTVLTAGMATVASNVLALYVFALQEKFPTIAAHLISASVLSAPAAVVMSKMFIPETGSPETLGLDIKPHYHKDANLFEAIINGANSGIRLIVGIVALLVAVLGLVALADAILGAFGNVVTLDINWSLKGLAGYICYPFALIMGIPFEDAGMVAQLLGQRALETEVPAYFALSSAIESGKLHNPRSIVIATYALCGFAHLASMAIFVGGTAAIAPAKTKMLSQIAFRALLAATFACFLTACVAGAFFMNSSLLLG